MPYYYLLTKTKMGNTSRELSTNSPAAAGFFNHVQSPQASMPTSPIKSPNRLSSPSFAYDTPTCLSAFDPSSNSARASSSARRHSVHSAARMVPQMHMHHQRHPNQDVVFYELDDHDGISTSDDSSTHTNSPQLHRKVERSRSEPKAPLGINVESQLVGVGGQSQHTNRYKTELCRAFLEAGHCKYGEKCQFAHGDREMRNVSRHPKYKTEYCRSFHATGLCAYGPRCHFIHNPDELNQPQSQQQQATPRRTSASSISEKTEQSQSSSETAGGRPRAISLSAFPPVPSRSLSHQRAIPRVGEKFMAEQLLEMGSCGNSMTTVSSAGSCYSGSYESSPLSMSPGIGGCASSSSCSGYDEYGWRNQEPFGGSNSGLDGLSNNSSSLPEEELPPWALALANLLQDLE